MSHESLPRKIWGQRLRKMAARAVAKLKAIDLDMKIASEASSQPVQGKQKNRIAALMRITRAQKWPSACVLR
jgi:hypothetical protein